jgi:hypothetical protein
MEFHYGTIIKTPPKNFAPPEAWPEWSTLADPMGFCRREWVGTNPRGVRWSLWPFTFEQYTTDTEPSLADSKQGNLARNRLVEWRRITHSETPAGWHSGKNPWRVDGYHELSPGDYTAGWHKNARRELRLWQENFEHKKYRIEEISLQEFEAAYKQSTVMLKMGTHLLAMLKRRLTYPETKNNSSLFGVRNLESGTIVAGTAAHYSPTHSASVRECPFMLPEAKSIFASTALVDRWFTESQKRSVALQVFTCFWFKGMPRGWKGSSEFKSHFGLRYVAYPPRLWRFVRGKFL